MAELAAVVGVWLLLLLVSVVSDEVLDEELDSAGAFSHFNG